MFVFCQLLLYPAGGWRSHVEDSPHPRLHTQTAAREEEIIRPGARGHHVRQLLQLWQKLWK